MPGSPAVVLFNFLKRGDGAHHRDVNHGGDCVQQWDNYAGPGCQDGGREAGIFVFFLLLENISVWPQWMSFVVARRGHRGGDNNGTATSWKPQVSTSVWPETQTDTSIFFFFKSSCADESHVSTRWFHNDNKTGITHNMPGLFVHTPQKIILMS